MFYVEKAVAFLESYDVFVLPALFALVWVFGIINWCKNPYGKQNKKFQKCQRDILCNRNLAGLYVAELPETYRRQWRAYVNSSAERPSLVFEFVPRKNRVIFIPLFVLCAILSTCYLAIFVLNVGHHDYVIFQAAFWLAFTVTMLVNNSLSVKKEKYARQTFGRFVAQLNASQKATEQASPNGVVSGLNQIKKTDVGDGALEKASTLLRKNGLDQKRSADEQRKINEALNGLLQAYARNAKKQQTTKA